MPELTRWLELEGVRRIVITTEDPTRYRGVDAAADRRGAATATELLDGPARAGGDPGRDGADPRPGSARPRSGALRKRGKLADPAQRVVINERVCEGCGDCGQEVDCLSVQPVETEFGRKTQIHQSSCNKDYSCLEGDCPSFLTVVPRASGAERRPSPTPPDRRCPSRRRACRRTTCACA